MIQNPRNNSNSIDWTTVTYASPAKKKPQRKETTCNILIIATSDGFITVFGPRHVHVQFINRPHVSTAGDGLIVDNLIDNVLPQPYKSIHFPGCVIATGIVGKLKPSDIRRRIDNLRLLNSFGASNKKFTDVRTATLRILEG